MKKSQKCFFPNMMFHLPFLNISLIPSVLYNVPSTLFSRFVNLEDGRANRFSSVYERFLIHWLHEVFNWYVGRAI